MCLGIVLVPFSYSLLFPPNFFGFGRRLSVDCGDGDTLIRADASPGRAVRCVLGKRATSTLDFATLMDAMAEMDIALLHSAFSLWALLHSAFSLWHWNS